MTKDKDIQLINDFLFDRLDNNRKKRFVERLQQDVDFKNDFLHYLTTKDAIYDDVRLSELILKYKRPEVIKEPIPRMPLLNMIIEIGKGVLEFFIPKTLAQTVKPIMLIALISFSITFFSPRLSPPDDEIMFFGAPNPPRNSPAGGSFSDSNALLKDIRENGLLSKQNAKKNWIRGDSLFIDSVILDSTKIRTNSR